MSIDGAGLVSTLNAATATRSSVGLDLFPDLHVTLTGAFDSTMTDGTLSWLGHRVDAAGHSTDASFVLRPDGLGGVELSTGQVWANGSTFQLQRIAQDQVAVVEVAPNAYNRTDPEPPQPSTEPMETVNPLAVPTDTVVDPEAVADAPMEASAGAGAYVDVLALYTPAAESTSTDVVARIKNYIANGNLANQHDNLSWRFRLVRVQRQAFTETADYMDGDLTKVQSSSAIQTLRSNYGADLVMVAGSWGNTNQRNTTPAAAYCGLSYQPDGSTATYSSYGYSVVEVDSAHCSSTAAAHELGHNMTLRHDWAHSDGTNSPYTYNHGYNSVPGDFSTIMAYDSPACPGGSCAMIPYWSNPNANYSNVPRGMAEITPTPAYDAKALGITGPEVAKWVSNPNPFGSLDSAELAPNGVSLRGWAIDPDRRTGAISVQALVDGVVVSTGTANGYRSDVGASYPSYGPNHGFVITAPASGGTHTICAKAVNYSFGTINTQLPSCRTITVPVDPVGQITSVTRIPGGARVQGWALDPDTAGMINVHVSIDGVTQTTPNANLSSPVPPSSWAAWGTSHGFSTNLTMSSGVAHNICVAGMNVDEGVNTTLDCQSVTLNGDTVGSYRTVHYFSGGLAVEGWGLDQDSTSAINFQVTMDGAVKSALGGYNNATDYSVPDSWASGYGYNRGFWIPFGPISVGTHSVCVTALNVSGTGGLSTSLGCRSIYYTHDPVGSFTAFRSAANVVSVVGWAIDPDTNDPISVAVTAAGVTNPSVVADQAGTVGNSVAPADQYGDRHAFQTQTVVPVDLKGNPQTVCVTALNAVGSPGNDASIGCVQV